MARLAQPLVLLSALCAVQAAAQESLVDADRYRAIAADRRAYRIGDILTVNVLETARARSGATTDAASDVSLRASGASNGWRGGVSGSVGAANSGGAETSRIGELRTQLSVQVVAVRPDGTLAVEGAQSLVINGEDQRIVLRGLVRPEDIRTDNTVWSHRIANARVEFSGSGVISESQRQSVLYRIMKWLRLA